MAHSSSTPFFHGFHRTLFGRPARCAKAALKERCRRLAASGIEQLQGIFSGRLPSSLFEDAMQKGVFRDRIYTLPLTFWAFLGQVLSPSSACREAVVRVQTLLSLHDQPLPSSDTKAYCKARRRLPVASLEKIDTHIATRLEAGASAGQLWKGRHVRVVDGTSASMPDTPANQAAYPQPTNQKPGCGFPVIRLVGLFSLATGALLALAEGTLHVHESRLFERLWKWLEAGDLLLSDRGFCSFRAVAALERRAIDVLMRNHQARHSDFRRGKRLGKNDHLIEWRKPAQRPKSMSAQDYAALPGQLTLREMRFIVATPGMRTTSITLVTTLLDPQQYSLEELAGLYLMRWKVELFFDDIKTAMGMDVLRCKSPEMIAREILMHRIAYNLIRALIHDASAIHHVEVWRISFKGSVDRLRQWAWPIAMASSKTKRAQLIERLLATIASDKVPLRPERREPRVKKRRPKAYQWMTKPRHEMKEIPHRTKYTKSS